MPADMIAAHDVSAAAHAVYRALGGDIRGSRYRALQSRRIFIEQSTDYSL